MGKIIALVNQKGGVGKTTSSINLAASLGVYKKRTLLVDLDPQGNSTTGVGISKTDYEKSVYELLKDDTNLEEVIIKTKFNNLYVIPATINLAGLDFELMEKSKLDPTFVKGSQLKKHLSRAKEIFDYIIIDCPPSLGLLTINALTAANSIMIPIQCEYYALEGVGQLMNTVNLIKRQLNKDLYIEGVVLTMNDARTNLSTQVINEVKKYFKDNVYKTIIPRNVKLSEAPSYGMPITAYAPRSKGAKCYEKLANELLKSKKHE